MKHNKIILNPNHPVLEGMRLLCDPDEFGYGGDILRETDETACLSTLMDPVDFNGWTPLSQIPEIVGKTIPEALKDDVDASERVFRRPHSPWKLANIALQRGRWNPDELRYAAMLLSRIGEKKQSEYLERAAVAAEGGEAMCPSCQRILPMKRISGMTAYHCNPWDDDDSINSNTCFAACEECGEEYVEYWQERWDELY